MPDKVIKWMPLSYIRETRDKFDPMAISQPCPPPNIAWGFAVAQNYESFRYALGPHWKMWRYLPYGNVRGLADTTLLLIGQYWRNTAVNDNLMRMAEYCQNRDIKRVKVSDLWEDNKALFTDDGRLIPQEVKN
jgi:hypothetical protein